jgi:hypothetical protein
MAMTLKELRDKLAELPAEMDEHLVFLASDPEGNAFHSVNEVYVGWAEDDYRPDRVTSYEPGPGADWVDAMNSATLDHFYGDDSYDEGEDEDEPQPEPGQVPDDIGANVRAVVIWP